jgi:hypothetical protein
LKSGNPATVRGGRPPVTGKANRPRIHELLGKHVDIGLFTERSEININYKDPESLEKAIKERVKRLLNADVIDVTPVGLDLDEELGIFDASSDVEDAEGEEPDA